MKHDQYNDLRNRYYRRKVERTAEKVGSGLWVGGETLVNSNTVIGDNVHLGELQIRGEGRVTVGDNVHSGTGCEILTENHNYEGDAIPYDESVIRKSVSIGDNVWIGINVIIIPGVSIGEGAIVQSGSVVTHDIPRGAIAGGHPAEVFDHRDMDHYERLKADGKFN
ncbi:acyltransferase [Halovenus marina]|uniref:acyltransferase n=1 Tax=Halovenus marina TaxID=3396621 RepID=UPI003F5612CB